MVNVRFSGMSRVQGRAWAPYFVVRGARAVSESLGDSYSPVAGLGVSTPALAGFRVCKAGCGAVANSPNTPQHGISIIGYWQGVLEGGSLIGRDVPHSISARLAWPLEGGGRLCAYFFGR
jgi:hypothetical protein